MKTNNAKALIVTAALTLTLASCATTKHEAPPPAPEPVAAPEPAPAPEPVMKIVKKEKVLDATELFAFDSATLSAGGMATLDELVQETGGATIGAITVTGHTDRIGSDDYNMRLSQRRANAVADYMISKGVPTGSIEAIGKGESEPVVQCDDADWKALVECLAPNRRVEVVYPIMIEEEVMIQN